MNKKVIGIGIICSFFMLTLFLTTTVPAWAKDTLRVGLSSDPTNVNPFEYRSSDDVPAYNSNFQGMMKAQYKTGEMVLDLAESINIMENGKDLKIGLRKDLKFSTGEPVTAHDVRFSWQQYLDKENKCLLASVVNMIKDVEVLDDHNFIYRFDRPFAAWESLMTLNVGSKNYFEKVGREEWRKKPVGTGPFVLTDRKIGEYITYERVENHHDYQVDYQTLKLIPVPDEMTRIAMLETGELDIVSSILPHQVKRLERNSKVKIKRCEVSPNFNYIGARMHKNPTSQKLRQAFNYAIDRQQIVDKLFLGEAYPIYMCATRIELGYDPDYKIEFNPEKARQLVKESGYKPGTPITLTYALGFSANPTQVASAVQNYMKDVGVTIKPQQLDYGTLLTYHRTKDPRAGEFYLSDWPGSRDPIWRFMLQKKSTGFYNLYPNRPNKDIVDQLCDQQAVEMDKEKRLAIIKKLHGLLNEDPDLIPLFGLYIIYGMRDGIDYTWTDKDQKVSHLYHVKIQK